MGRNWKMIHLDIPITFSDNKRKYPSVSAVVIVQDIFIYLFYKTIKTKL